MYVSIYLSICLCVCVCGGGGGCVRARALFVYLFGHKANCTFVQTAILFSVFVCFLVS